MENVLMVLVFLVLGLFALALVGLAVVAALDIWMYVLDRVKQRY